MPHRHTVTPRRTVALFERIIRDRRSPQRLHVRCTIPSEQERPVVLILDDADIDTITYAARQLRRTRLEKSSAKDVSPSAVTHALLAALLLLLATPAFAQHTDVRYFPNARDGRNHVARDARSDVRYVEITPWPNGRVPIVFDGDRMGVDQQARLFRVCEQFAETPPFPAITCVPWSGETSWLRVVQHGGGCSAFLGANPSGGESVMSLDPECWGTHDEANYTIAHEIAHAFGLPHQHQRLDRDAFVEIHWSHVQPERAWTFEKVVTNYPLVPEYDFASITHYFATTWSADGEPTLTPLAWFGDVTVGGLTPTSRDAEAIGLIYGTRHVEAPPAARMSLTPITLAPIAPITVKP